MREERSTSETSTQQRPPIITIDGPSGAGKSSVSKALAERLGYTYIDTGAMFRAVALAAKRRQIDFGDEEALAAMLSDVEIAFTKAGDADHVTLDGEDVEALIRHPDIGKGASDIGVHPKVRSHLLALQRALGQQGGVILEGRDTGTVVFPQAEIKIFLDASPQERARRRLKQLGPDAGMDLETIQAAIEARDKNDSQRAVAPLRCAQDATRIDASTLSFEQVIARILALTNKHHQS